MVKKITGTFVHAHRYVSYVLIFQPF